MKEFNDWEKEIHHLLKLHKKAKDPKIKAEIAKAVRKSIKRVKKELNTVKGAINGTKTKKTKR